MKTLYLDNAATTPLAIEVTKELNKQIKNYGNPSSRHAIGKTAKEEVEKVREKIAKFINAKPEEIFFTSGATESNNWAMKGTALANPLKKHILISCIEHPSILETCETIKKQGYTIDLVSVNKEGVINIEELKKKISDNTLLVSIMHVNNEIGTIQPLEEIAKICKEKNIVFHTDAVQSFGKIKIDASKVDLLSVSGHKLNAIKGIGFLYIKKGTKISPLLNGGGQERNMRSGTENFLGIVSIGKAIELKRRINEASQSRVRIIKKLLKIPGTILNGSIERGACNIISLSFYGIEGESLQMLLDEEGISVSTGSACSSNKLSASHVLKAIGVDEYHINGNIRLSLGTLEILTKAQENILVKKIKENVKKLQKISPIKFEEHKK